MIDSIVEPKYLLPETFLTLFPIGRQFISRTLIDKVIDVYHRVGDHELVCKVPKGEQAKAMEKYRQLRAVEFASLQTMVADEIGQDIAAASSSSSSSSSVASYRDEFRGQDRFDSHRADARTRTDVWDMDALQSDDALD